MLFRYLIVYVPAVLGDWLQGPYLYALYSNYGYNISTIAAIFMTGYASAVVFGTLVSSLGDVWGHRTNVFLYGTYAALAYSEHDYPIFCSTISQEYAFAKVVAK